MKSILKLVLGLAMVSSTLIVPEAALSEVYVRTTDVVFAYRDGYYDAAHRWHPWLNRAELIAYRRDHRRNFCDWDHDRFDRWCYRHQNSFDRDWDDSD